MGWRFLYYASDKRYWQCLTSSHLLLLHLPLWEHSGNQKGDKGTTEIDKKTFTCPWYVQEYRTVETGAATAACRGTAWLINLSFARPCSLHCILMEDNIQTLGQARVKQGVF